MNVTRRLLIPLTIACLPTASSPMSIIKTVLKRGAPAALATGACYFGLTQDGRKTRTTVWQAAQKVKEHTTEAACNLQTWLDTKFGEQKDEHALMINLLAELQKQNKRLKTHQATTLDEVYDVKAQQIAILDKISDLEVMVAALQQQKIDALSEAPTSTARGVIRIEAEEAGC